MEFKSRKEKEVSKTITMDFSEYENDLKTAENKGESTIIQLINKAKKLGVIQFEYEELKSNVSKAQDSQARFQAGEMFRKGLL